MTKYLTLLLSAVVLAATARGSDADPEPPMMSQVREVRIGIGLTKDDRFAAPTRIKSREELAAVMNSESLEKTILKVVDFRKEHLLLFAWGGSSGDRLKVAGKASEATFEYTAGKTDDVFRHVKMFAVPARAKVKVVNK